MAKEFVVGGTTYQFPDSYSDEKVQEILTKQGIIKPPPVLEKNPTVTLPTSPWDMMKSMGASDVEEAQTAGPANAAVGQVVAPTVLGGIGAGALATKLGPVMGPTASNALAGGGIGVLADLLSGGNEPLKSGAIGAVGGALGTSIRSPRGLLEKLLRGASKESSVKIPTPPTFEPNLGGTTAPAAKIATPPVSTPSVPATYIGGGNTLGALTKTPSQPTAVTTLIKTAQKNKKLSPTELQKLKEELLKELSK